MPRKPRHAAPPRLEALEDRLTPSGVSESFDSTPAGAIPAGWAQWSSSGAAAFAVSSARALSTPDGLGVSASASTLSARSWVSASQPADVQASAAVYLSSPIPAQVLARGSNLNTSTP